MSTAKFVVFSILFGVLAGLVAGFRTPIEQQIPGLGNLCCCLPSIIFGGASVSATLFLEKESKARQVQAAMVGFLSGIVSIPMYYLSAVGIQWLSALFIVVKLESDSPIAGATALSSMSFFSQIMNTLGFAPFALVFSTLGGVLFLNVFHRSRIQ